MSAPINGNVRKVIHRLTDPSCTGLGKLAAQDAIKHLAPADAAKVEAVVTGR